jgi:hypothetical protein
LDVRYALVSNRDEIFFRQDFPHRSIVPDVLIAVKIGSDWRFYDPASTYVPADMLAWQHEGVTALVSDSSKGIFVTTPISSPELSLIRRTADMKLSADGTLEGDVRVEYTGHSGADEKEQFDELAATEQESTVKESLQARLGSNVEVTNIKFENVTDPTKPMSYTYHIRLASYAQRTGRRLFFQPGYFQKGVGPRFTGESRVHPIYFPYPSVEEQVVTIELPEGFELDNADLPPPFVQKAFVTQDIGIAVSGDKRAIQYSRKSAFTVPALLFRSSQYSALKQMYDLYYSRDNHTLSLRQTNGRNQ